MRPHTALGAIYVILNGGAPQYLRSLLDVNLLDRQHKRAREAGEKFGDEQRVIELLDELKRLLDERRGKS